MNPNTDIEDDEGVIEKILVAMMIERAGQELYDDAVMLLKTAVRRYPQNQTAKNALEERQSLDDIVDDDAILEQKLVSMMIERAQQESGEDALMLLKTATRRYPENQEAKAALKKLSKSNPDAPNEENTGIKLVSSQDTPKNSGSGSGSGRMNFAPSWMSIAASIALFTVGGLTGWALSNSANPKHPKEKFPIIAVQAISSYQTYQAYASISEARKSISEARKTKAVRSRTRKNNDEDNGLLTLEQTEKVLDSISKAIGWTVNEPNLSDLGWWRNGAIKVPSVEFSGVQIAFKNSNNKLATVLIVVSYNDNIPAKFLQREKIGTWFETKRNLDLAVSSDIPKKEIKALFYAITKKIQLQ